MHINDIISEEENNNNNNNNIGGRKYSDSKDIMTYDTTKYHNSRSGPGKRALLEEYRLQCREYLIKDLDWPENLAKKVAGKLSVPREGITFADWMIGLSVGSLPDRYLDPVAKLMRTDKRFYTRVNIAADVVALGVSALAIYGMNIEHKSEIVRYVFDFLNNGAPQLLLYANVITRAIQIPYRSIRYFHGKHTWSAATIINPNIPEAAVASLFIGYDQVKKFKERKKKQE